MTDTERWRDWLPAEPPEPVNVSRPARVDHRVNAELCRSLIRPTRPTSQGNAPRATPRI